MNLYQRTLAFILVHVGKLSTSPLVSESFWFLIFLLYLLSIQAFVLYFL
jgi:hypothetical protein